jgi:c-di-GMP-binding flagellar brake protein YcgR
VVEGVEGTLLFTTHVDILNISINGVALKAHRRLEIGREYVLKLEYKDRVVSVNGVVVWSVLSELTEGPHAEKVPVYKAGMRFTNIISDKMQKLLEFIESHKLSHDERLNIRFTIKAPDKAILDGPHNYDVRNMSMRGMLIETDMRFDVDARYPMEIALEGDRTIKVLGRVVSCLEVNDRAPKHYAIGIEFVEMSEEDRKKLKEFVKAL